MKRKVIKSIGWGLFLLILLGNFIACNHAYRFTHFADSGLEKTRKPEELSFGQKLHTLLWGVQVPKAVNREVPVGAYETIRLDGAQNLEAWLVPVPDRKGTVILFHGFSSSKSSLLAYAQEFTAKGYATLLVDFRGSGGSSGFTTTIGFKEAEDVTAAVAYARERFPEDELILFGCSMGAAAIMKAAEDNVLPVDKLIIECPFGSLLTTTRTRFEAMGFPAFPFAELLLFYGGLHTGFNPFKHNPTDYAEQITIPTLLLYGAKDQRVSRQEIDQIYANLAGEKELVVFPNSGHEIYLNDHRADWNRSVDGFLALSDQ